MSTITKIVGQDLHLDFKKQHRCSHRFPKGTKLLKNNHDYQHPLKLFFLCEYPQGCAFDGPKEEFTFFLTKQDDVFTEIPSNIKLEANEHIKTFTNELGTWHLFKLNYE